MHSRIRFAMRQSTVDWNSMSTRRQGFSLVLELPVTEAHLPDHGADALVVFVFEELRRQVFQRYLLAPNQRPSRLFRFSTIALSPVRPRSTGGASSAGGGVSELSLAGARASMSRARRRCANCSMI